MNVHIDVVREILMQHKEMVLTPRTIEIITEDMEEMERIYSELYD